MTHIVQIISLLHSSENEFAESDSDDVDERFVGFAVPGCLRQDYRIPLWILRTDKLEL